MDRDVEVRFTEQGRSLALRQTIVPTQPRRRAHSVDEAAAILGISRAHAYELVGRNELGHVRLGRRILIPVQVLDDLLDVVDRGPSSSAPSDSAS